MHPQPLHDRLRSRIPHAGHRHHFVDVGAREYVRDGCRGSFSCEALTPVFESKSPADLYRRSERCIECLPTQSSKANESTRVAAFHRPQTEAMLSEMGPDPLSDKRIAGLLRHGRLELLHHYGVSVQYGERAQVGIDPVAQDQSRCGDLRSVEAGGLTTTCHTHHRAAWSIALKALIKWGPVVFAAGRKALPYLRDNPAAQKFVQSMAEQTAALPDKLSGEARAKRKIGAVQQSLAEAATLGMDPQQYARWRAELDELSRTVVLAQAATRRHRKVLLRRCEHRLDRLVAEILPALTSRGRPAPPSDTLPSTAPPHAIPPPE